MTDAELTGLAFKAAFSGADINHDKDMLKHWSPLTDDGDALRLAVSLGMNVGNMGCDSIEAWCISEVDGSVCRGIVAKYDDPTAATRRAIVRAAAEIGRAMP